MFSFTRSRGRFRVENSRSRPKTGWLRDPNNASFQTTLGRKDMAYLRKKWPEKNSSNCASFSERVLKDIGNIL